MNTPVDEGVRDNLTAENGLKCMEHGAGSPEKNNYELRSNSYDLCDYTGSRLESDED